MQPANDTRKKWILIVEDDDDFREAVAAFLDKQGYRTVHASKVLEAMNKLNNQKFECVLLDMKFDYRSGEQVVDYMRNTVDKNQNSTTPIIVMSGYLDPKVVKKIAPEVSFILVKPFETSLLLEKIQAACQAAAEKKAK